MPLLKEVGSSTGDRALVGGGKTIPLSVPRRFIVDLLHFARRVPSLPVERVMKLEPLAQLRSSQPDRLSWTVLFLKAFALMAREFPQLRTSFLEYPYPRLFQHDQSVASLALEKEVQGENAILFLKLRSPEDLTLEAIKERIQLAKVQPLESNANFRLLMGVSRLPLLLRRLLWWITLEWSGPWRARKFGTFGLSSYGNLGAESLHPLSPLTATLNFGPVDPQGVVRVRVIYDHRVCDGAMVARALARLEEILLGPIRDELESGREKGKTNDSADRVWENQRKTA